MQHIFFQTFTVSSFCWIKMYSIFHTPEIYFNKFIGQYPNIILNIVTHNLSRKARGLMKMLHNIRMKSEMNARESQLLKAKLLKISWETYESERFRSLIQVIGEKNRIKTKMRWQAINIILHQLDANLTSGVYFNGWWVMGVSALRKFLRRIERYWDFPYISLKRILDPMLKTIISRSQWPMPVFESLKNWPSHVLENNYCLKFWENVIWKKNWTFYFYSFLF